MSSSTHAQACILPAILLPGLLSACAARSDYPSLGLRDAERITGSAEPVTAASPAPPPSLPSGDLAQRLVQLVDQARAAHGRFTDRRPAAERSVGGGGSIGSEGWAAATVALSALDSARSEGMIVLAELDGLYAAAEVATAESGNPADREAVAAARREVEAWVAEEDDVLVRLRGRIAG